VASNVMPDLRDERCVPWLSFAPPSISRRISLDRELPLGEVPAPGAPVELRRWVVEFQ
jgi:hypothetical protein